MEVLFLKLDTRYEEFGNIVLSTLGFSSFAESETTFNTQGYYFVANILGVSIKVEENCYDYEEQYNCLITIKQGIGIKLANDNSLSGVAEVIASVLAAKLKTEIAMEMAVRTLEQETYDLKIFYYENDEVHTEIRTYPNK